MALSLYKAKYITLKKAVKKQMWLNSVFNKLKPIITYIKISLIYYNNKSAIDLLKNLKHYTRLKYIDIQYYYVRDYIKKQLFKLQYIPINNQLVDALTKALDINIYKGFISRINLKDSNCI